VALKEAETKLQRSGRMADPHDQPDSEPNGASIPPEQTPPEKKPPAKAAKKAPAKKAPAKKAVAKKTPAKKAPAKKAPPAKSPAPEPPKPPAPSEDLQHLIGSNGEISAAAKDAAAQAKSTVDDANNPVAPTILPAAPGQSAVPLAFALALSLLAILLIRQLRRR
jgi:hypothetical protein